MSHFPKLILLAAALAAPFSAVAQNENVGIGTAIVTILPKHNATTATLPAPNELHLKANGREAAINGLKPLTNATSPIELVVMIDEGARSSLGNQLDDIAKFLMTMPPDARLAVGYMNYGRADLATPLTTDHAKAVSGLRLPTRVGSTGAYFSLSELAKHWPSNDPTARRQVLLITDGVDPFYPRIDLDDPYVQTAIENSVRAHIVVYSIYWQNGNRFSRGMYMAASGQNRLAQVTEATGGRSFWIGTGNPVSMIPYFDEMQRRFQNQYELHFTTTLRNKPEVVDMKLKVAAPDVEVTAPTSVWITPVPVGAN